MFAASPGAKATIRSKDSMLTSRTGDTASPNAWSEKRSRREQHARRTPGGTRFALLPKIFLVTVLGCEKVACPEPASDGEKSSPACSTRAAIIWRVFDAGESWLTRTRALMVAWHGCGEKCPWEMHQQERQVVRRDASWIIAAQPRYT